MCIGLHFAEMQIKLVMNELLQRYRWSRARGLRDASPTITHFKTQGRLAHCVRGALVRSTGGSITLCAKGD
jgi:cytochrome P450